MAMFWSALLNSFAPKAVEWAWKQVRPYAEALLRPDAEELQ